MLVAEVVPQYIDLAEETVEAGTAHSLEQEAEPRGERIHPEDVPYIMARGSLLGQIAAKRGLLATVDSAREAGITIDEPLAIDLRREIRLLKRDFKALTNDVVNLQLIETEASDDIEKAPFEQTNEYDEFVFIEENHLEPDNEQRYENKEDTSNSEPWNPFTLVKRSTAPLAVKAAPGAPVCIDKALEIDPATFYPDVERKPNVASQVNDSGTDKEWQKVGLCAQTDPESFFPEKGGSLREAKKICVGCEVKAECLEYALDNDERFGIWGGLSERERRRLKRRTK